MKKKRVAKIVGGITVGGIGAGALFLTEKGKKVQQEVVRVTRGLYQDLKDYQEKRKN